MVIVQVTADAREFDVAPTREPSGSLVEVQASLAAIAERETGILGDALRHHLGRPGKLLRAQIALAAAGATRVDPAVAVPIATACELLHNASLVHDDLQDRDRLRRGQAAVWTAFGPEQAVNVGDFLLAAALDTASRVSAPRGSGARLVQAFSGAALELIRGQVRDNDPGASRLRCFQSYCEIAAAKTAPLLSLPVEAAMLLAGADRAPRLRCREAFRELGLAYQIVDDLLDLLGAKRRPGCGDDLSRGRPNAVAVLYLAETDVLAHARGDGPLGPEDRARILASSAPRRALERARAHADRGRALLGVLPGPLGPSLEGVLEPLWVRVRGLDPETLAPARTATAPDGTLHAAA